MKYLLSGALTPDGRGVRIKSDYDDLRSSRGFLSSCTALPFVHYRVRLPRATSLRIHDYKSDTDVKDFGGSLTFETYKGSAALVGLSDFEGSRSSRTSRHSDSFTSATVGGGGARVELKTERGKFSVRKG